MRALAGRRSKYAVIALWLVMLAAAGGFAGKLSGAEKNDASSFLPGSAESTKVLNAEDAFRSPNTIVAVVVLTRAPQLTNADRARIVSYTAAFAKVAPLGGPVLGPLWSRDGEAAEITLPYNLGDDGWSKTPGVVSKIDHIVQGPQGLNVYVTGALGNAADSNNAFKGIDSTLLYAAAGVVIFILLLTYRSPFLWLLPVISAGVALTTAEAVVYLFATHAGLVVNAESVGILTVLVFGAGTDYALLLVARYREELRRHEDRHEAMAVALHRARAAIIASGSTVIAGMLCLLAAVTNSTRGLGPVAAIGVVVGLASMLTLLPALLVTVGRWVFWPARPDFGSHEPTTTGIWARVGARVKLRPRAVWTGTVLALGVLALGIFDLHANGLTEKQSFRGTPGSVTGEEVLSRHFPAGEGSPVVVIANASKEREIAAILSKTPGIVAVSPPLVAHGMALVQGTLASPAVSAAAYATVERVRAEVHPVPGANAKVGGDSAINLDVENAAHRDRDVVIPIILVVVFAILALLLRALLAPVLLVATVALSFAAAMGVSAVFFDYVIGVPATDSAFPLFVFVFLVALGIDYNIFLMTRVREETISLGTRSGALRGLATTGGVITSAGFVLAGTFAVLATLPVTEFAEIGFAVAFGVLLDTIVVRSVVVTALNLDLGDRIWWPFGAPRNNTAIGQLTGPLVAAESR
ncbi:MAG TPA: MMPL family transporter [Acidimicrobiales bacterium]|nr:MMPL family transporter [Acidimicrobiales bacterium]